MQPAPCHHTLDESRLGPEKIGVVISRFGSQVDIEPDDSLAIYRCHLRANIGDIVVGDTVIWRDDPSENKGIVESVKDRRSELLRPDSFGKLKLIAANIDRVLLVVAPEPEPFANLIDRYLVIAENSSLDIHIVINKSDLLMPGDQCSQLIEVYSALNYPVHLCSSKTEGNLSLIESITAEGCSIFAGQSGVGKSSIISKLLPEQDIKVGELSRGVKKGKHTTTYAKLYHFKHGGDCIDSPGIREFGLWHLNQAQVNHGFKEIRQYATRCRFRDCSHQNEPDCAVLAAVHTGSISANRFKSFQLIIQSLDQVDVIDRH